MDSSKSKIKQFFNQLLKNLSKSYILSKSFFITLRKKFFQLKSQQKQIALDKKLVISLTKTKIPNLKQLKYFKKYFSQTEKWVFNLSLLVILISLIFLGFRFYLIHLKTLPIEGGEYSEALVGSPKFINPLYSNISDVDNDLVSLIFSSLFKRDKNGKLINDLAESYEISQDNKSYLIKIRADVKWHNGNLLTVNDILFTFNAIKNPRYKSSLHQSFTGVEIEKVNNQTIKFVLAEPYAAFLDLLTFGIIPQELWQQITADYANLAELNLKPIGSGPFKFKSLVKDKAGNIKSYTLISNNKYYYLTPYISQLNFKFFANFTEAVTALNDNLVDGLSYLPPVIKDQVLAKDTLNFYQLNLPQLYAIFFNLENNSILADKKVRQALAYALDKNKLISLFKEQDIRLIDSPILPDNFAYDDKVKRYNFDSKAAIQLLDEAGWKITELTDEEIKKVSQEPNSKDEAIKKQANEIMVLGAGKWRSKDKNFLIIELVAIDSPEIQLLINQIANDWQAIGVKTIIKPFPASQIQTEVIKPRKFMALFYSEITGADPDPYAFWHSSQIGSNGLNIADYSNKEVDKLLEDARLSNDLNLRKEKYIKFQEIMAEEVPAIFLYSPNYLYLQDKKVKGFAVKKIIMPGHRFANINEWYVKIGKKLVW